MNNKEQAWRLEDENGKKVGKEPNEAAIKMFFDGKEIGRMQSITFNNGSRINNYYEIGTPTTRPTRGQGWTTFAQEYLGDWINENEEENNT